MQHATSKMEDKAKREALLVPCLWYLLDLPWKEEAESKDKLSFMQKELYLNRNLAATRKGED